MDAGRRSIDVANAHRSPLNDRIAGFMMNYRPEERFPPPSPLNYYPPLSNYHDLKRIMPVVNGVIVECIYCQNKDPVTGEPNSLALLDASSQTTAGKQSSMPPPGDSGYGHTAYILPCGHVAGWSCLWKDGTTRCPACRTLWCRQPEQGRERPNYCPHNLMLHVLSLTRALTPEESDWLIPPGGFVPDHCRPCATKDALQDMTKLIRKGAPRERCCLYATDSLINGILDTDDLKPFTALELVVDHHHMLPAAMVEEMHRREEAIHLRYEGKTPWAESKHVGAAQGGRFSFRVAGLGRPVSEGEYDNSTAPSRLRWRD